MQIGMKLNSVAPIKKMGIQPYGHDSTVVIVDHEKKDIICFILERLTRVKHDYRFVGPILDELSESIDEECKLLCSCHDVDVKLIDYFRLMYERSVLLKKENDLFSKKIPKVLKGIDYLKLKVDRKKFEAEYKKHVVNFRFERNEDQFKEYLANRYKLKSQNILFYDHHFTHACCAYYFAPKEFRNNCIVLTADGQGDNKFASVYKATKDNNLELVSESKNECSIPMLYTICTKVLGFRPNSDEGKLEALANFGIPQSNDLYKTLQNTFQVNEKFEITIKKNKSFPFESIPDNYDKIELLMKSFLDKMKREDFAADIQFFFEEFLLSWAKKIKRNFPELDYLAVAGGAFANVKLNLRIFEDDVFKEIYVYPAMGDDGTPLGGIVYNDYLEGKEVDWYREITMPYFGPAYSNKEVEHVLASKKYKNKISYTFIGNEAYKELAEDIVGNKICALFQGRSEFGPRALGNRSILANPRNPETRELINTKFKKREIFQPFCPSILEEEREKLFEKSYLNKHMTCAFRMKKEFHDDLPSIIHVDGTGRAQFVEKKDNEFYFNLLKRLKEINEYGVVLNTSFNIHGKAMVMTPEHALEDFFSCNIDHLYIEGFKVSRKS